MPVQTTLSPDIFFQAAHGYQRTFALKTAVDLELFTGISEGADTVAALAKRCTASERGIRILCDFLTIQGMLTKSDGRYQLSPEAATFMVKSSPAYFGSTLDFLIDPQFVAHFSHLTETVRRGTPPPDFNTVAGREQEHWVQFARAMVPMMMPSAMTIADILQVASAGPMRILDIAAGHGIFGLVLAQRNPKAEVVAVDWPGVLAVATENAAKMGVGSRLHTRPGDAFTVDYGGGYDVALLTNFLHHYDPSTCMALLRKVAAALNPGGRVAILEFVPNADRVTPPNAAAFSLTMLGTTPAGDAYTFAELKTMATEAGFTSVTSHPTPTPETVVVATK